MIAARNMSSAVGVRRTRSVESFRTAAECIGDVTPGMSLFAITRGQFSMIDAALACLDQTGPAAISVWTWTVADYEIDCMERLRKDDRILAGRLIIDAGSRGRNAGLIRQWQSSFGAESVRYVVNHAKMFTIQNERFKLLLRGSMNLNFNPRFEQLDITEGGADFELVQGIEQDLPVLADTASGAEAYKASRVSEAFDADQLAMFTGVKTWTK